MRDNFTISSFDLRSSSGPGQHWKDDKTLGDRGYVFYEESPRICKSYLNIERLEGGDSGQYRCRVDYQVSPTRNTRIKLKLVGKIEDSSYLKVSLVNVGIIKFIVLYNPAPVSFTALMLREVLYVFPPSPAQPASDHELSRGGGEGRGGAAHGGRRAAALLLQQGRGAPAHHCLEEGRRPAGGGRAGL